MTSRVTMRLFLVAQIDPHVLAARILELSGVSVVRPWLRFAGHFENGSHIYDMGAELQGPTAAQQAYHYFATHEWFQDGAMGSLIAGDVMRMWPPSLFVCAQPVSVAIL